MKSKLSDFLLWTLLVGLILVSGYVAYLALYPYDPLRIDKIVPDKTTVCRGGDLCFQFEGEKFYDIPTNVVIELINGEVYGVMAYSSNSPKGKVFKKRCFIVPYNIKPNTYQIRWTGVYEFNALNHVRKTAKSEFITVTDQMKGIKGDRGPVGPRGPKGKGLFE
jgi:hypothetical protein